MSRERGLGLTAKLLLVTVALVVASFAAVYWIATDTSRIGLVDLSDTNLGLSAQNLSRAIDSSLADTRADAMATARLDLSAEPMDSGDPKNFEWFAGELALTKDKYAAIVAIDGEGIIRGANEREGEETPLEGQRCEGDWLDAIGEAEPREVVWIAPTRPACLDAVLREDEEVVGYALPVFDILDDRLGGVAFFVSTDHFAATLEGYVNRNETRVDSLALILDGEGRSVVLPAGLEDGTFEGATFSREALEGGVISTSEGQRYRAAGSPLERAGADAGWSVLLLTDQASFDAPIENLSMSLLWLFLIAVAIVVVALTLAGTRLLSPIRRLTDAVGKTTRAAEFTKLPVETTDEVGALTQTFNSIFGTLKEYEESLEQKVEERTEQLREAKQEVSDILDNMAQAIFTVGAERKVNQEYSAYCGELLGDVKIAGADALDLLGLREGSPPHKSLRFWLDTVIGGNELQWALAGGSGPVKEVTYERPTDGEEKVLQLEYAPIYADGALDKVMIIARDMTAVVRLQEEVIRKEDENRENLERVAELAQLDPELFEKFLAEADEIVGRCHDALTTLRTDMKNAGAVDELFRAMHTLKANARIFKMTSVQNVAHDAEDQFQKVRDGETKLTAEAIDALESQLALVRERLDEYDRLGQRVLLGQGGGAREALGRAEKPLDALGAVASRLGELVVAVDEGGDRKALDAATDEAKDLASRLGSLGMSQLAGRVVETLEAIQKKPVHGVEAAKKLFAQAEAHADFHRELARLPDAGAFLDEAEPFCQKVANELEAATGTSLGELNQLLGTLHSLKAWARSTGVRTVQDIAHAMEDRLAELRDGEEGLDESGAAGTGERLARIVALVGDAQQILDNATPKDARRQKGATMRIPAARIMEVRRTAKELARALDKHLPKGDLNEAYGSLDAAVRELTVVPLSDLFDRMTKMVLDLSIEVGKPTNDLAVEGGEIQVDTKLLEKMRDVLTHALRNAVDHGVEPAGERPSEKPRRATIGVKASWKDEDLVVAVEDDGRGIDLGRVRATAVQRNKLSEEDAAKTSDTELIELLFTPGFSTASRVTELSGRGVGLDVIRTTMRDLKGDAELRSTYGEGTTLTLRIPAAYYQQL